MKEAKPRGLIAVDISSTITVRQITVLSYHSYTQHSLHHKNIARVVNGTTP